MNIVIMNFSGNVGKSTISRHLFLPRLDNAQLIPIESINSDGSEDEQYRGSQFGELLDSLPFFDNAIIDVGASNVEDFTDLMKTFDGSHEFFDLFIIPTVSEKKQMKDTISTICKLEEIGVPAKKIRVVFNKHDHKNLVKNEFSGIFDFHAESKSFNLKSDAVIHNNELFTRLHDSNSTVSDILEDPTDYKALMAATPDKNEKVRLMRFLSTKLLASTVKKELDTVFKVITK